MCSGLLKTRKFKSPNLRKTWNIKRDFLTPLTGSFPTNDSSAALLHRLWRWNERKRQTPKTKYVRWKNLLQNYNLTIQLLQPFNLQFLLRTSLPATIQYS